MALLLCALFGLVVERILVRPFAERGSNAWLMATVAGGIVVDNIVLFTFGKEPRGFPSLLAQKPIEIFGTGIFPLQLVIPLVGLAIAVALQFAFQQTARGKALLAVVQNKRRGATDGHQCAERHRAVLCAVNRASRIWPAS